MHYVCYSRVQQHLGITQGMEHGAGAVGAQLGVRAGAEVSIRVVVSAEVGFVLFGFFFLFMSVFGFENGRLLAFARQSVNIFIKSPE